MPLWGLEMGKSTQVWWDLGGDYRKSKVLEGTKDLDIPTSAQGNSGRLLWEWAMVLTEGSLLQAQTGLALIRNIIFLFHSSEMIYYLSLNIEVTPEIRKL